MTWQSQAFWTTRRLTWWGKLRPTWRHWRPHWDKLVPLLAWPYQTVMMCLIHYNHILQSLYTYSHTFFPILESDVCIFMTMILIYIYIIIYIIFVPYNYIYIKHIQCGHMSHSMALASAWHVPPCQETMSSKVGAKDLKHGLPMPWCHGMVIHSVPWESKHIGYIYLYVHIIV